LSFDTIVTDGIIGRLLLDLRCGETTLVGQLGVRKHEVEEAEENVISIGKLDGILMYVNMMRK
jgi:hypothetical protein